MKGTGEYKIPMAKAKNLCQTKAKDQIEPARASSPRLSSP